MAYDEALADRVRAELESEPVVEEKRMMGGLVFMVHGHMCVGVLGPDLFVRCGADALDECLALPHARPMDFQRTPSKHMVYVGPEGTADGDELAAWVGRGLAFTRSLPPKS